MYVKALAAELRSWKEMEEGQVFSAVGEEGFRRLVRGFYAQVPGDEILGPMYPADDLAGAEERLLGFLIFRFGGPPAYIEQRGHPRLRIRHAPFVINQAARDRWVTLMTKSLDEAAFPSDARSVLENFFGSTASFLVNRPS